MAKAAQSKSFQHFGFLCFPFTLQSRWKKKGPLFLRFRSICSSSLQLVVWWLRVVSIYPLQEPVQVPNHQSKPPMSSALVGFPKFTHWKFSTFGRGSENGQPSFVGGSGGRACHLNPKWGGLVLSWNENMEREKSSSIASHIWVCPYWTPRQQAKLRFSCWLP